MHIRQSIKSGAFFLVAVLMAAFMSCSKSEQSEAQKKRDSMIIDTLDHAELYYSMHPRFQKAFEFLQQPDLAEKALGRYELEGDSLFCTISKDSGRTREEAKLEAHKKYIDIQYVIAGDETYGWKLFDECSDINQPYDESKDIMFFNDEPTTWTKVPPGSFVIFMAETDAHAPVVGDGEIHKVVIKVLK